MFIYIELNLLAAVDAMLRWHSGWRYSSSGRTKPMLTAVAALNAQDAKSEDASALHHAMQDL